MPKSITHLSTTSRITERKIPRPQPTDDNKRDKKCIAKTKQKEKHLEYELNTLANKKPDILHKLPMPTCYGDIDKPLATSNTSKIRTESINSLTKTNGPRDMADIETWCDTRPPFTEIPQPHSPQHYIAYKCVDDQLLPSDTIYNKSGIDIVINLIRSL